MHNFNDRLIRAALTKALENRLVFTGVANNSFSGEINQPNDIVQLNQMGDITVNSYTDGTDITNQEISLAALQITADQDKYIAPVLDTVKYNNDKATLLAEIQRKGGYAMNENVDQYIAALYDEAGITLNTNASPVDMTSLNVVDQFLEMSEKFADAGIAREVRKVAIIPPWVQTKLALAGIDYLTDNNGVYTAGYIGTALGWDFLESNNVSKNSSSWDKTRIMCVVPGESIGYAAAVTYAETTSIEKQVGKMLVKARMVYGAKLVRPDMTGVIYADKTAEA